MIAGEKRADECRGEAQAQRMKTWDECSIEEKLERLRDQQRGVARNQRFIIDDLRKRLAILESHQHNAAGDITVSLHTARHGGHELIGEAGARDALA